MWTHVRRRESEAVNRPDDWKPARAAFVVMIKDESLVGSSGRPSLRQHWLGAERGFADDRVEARYRDFLAGWYAHPQQEKP